MVVDLQSSVVVLPGQWRSIASWSFSTIAVALREAPRLSEDVRQLDLAALLSTIRGW
jgi:hypothetical protein